MAEMNAGGSSGLKITALSIQDAARVLSQAAGHAIPETMLRADIDAGAPVNPDGTINMIHFAAWIARETANNAD